MSRIEIREFRSPSDYAKCVELQNAVWGSEVEAVPTHELLVVHRYGGVCIGAFDGEEMVGFVYGMVGFEDGRTFHHSHLLAVGVDHRGRGIGERLKWAQRQRVLDQGLDFVNWTFDPLQARNAHFNINRLGVEIHAYLVNFYGEGRGPLQGRIPTDRFVADWRLTGPRVLDAREGRFPDSAERDDPPAVNTVERLGNRLICAALELERSEAAVRLEIPSNFGLLIEQDPDLALDWRMKTRRLFESYFARGYSVVGFHASKDRASYRLELHPRQPAPKSS